MQSIAHLRNPGGSSAFTEQFIHHCSNTSIISCQDASQSGAEGGGGALSIAHIPTQMKLTQLPNARRPNARRPNTTYIPLTRFGSSRWGNANFRFGVEVTQILAFLDTSMLVSPTRNCGVGGLSQREDPMRMAWLRSGI